MDQGIDAVERWLKPLLAPYVEEAYRVVRIQHGVMSFPTHPTSSHSHSPSSSSSSLSSSSSSSPPLPPSTSSPEETSPDFTPLTINIGHLALFNQQLQKTNRAVEWVYANSSGSGTKTTPIWAASVLVDGEPLGDGKGYTKRAARNEAAKVGLKNLGIFVWYAGFLLLFNHPFMILIRNFGAQIFILWI
jgi:ribonuclease-3